MNDSIESIFDSNRYDELEIAGYTVFFHVEKLRWFSIGIFLQLICVIVHSAHYFYH